MRRGLKVSEWHNWGDDWPTWQDVDRHVEVLTKNEWYRGRLIVEDTVFDGEDEIPLYAVETPSGLELQFADHEAWRFA